MSVSERGQGQLKGDPHCQIQQEHGFAMAE